MSKLFKYVGSKLCYFPGIPSACELNKSDVDSLVISGITNGSTTKISVNLYDSEVTANASNADLYESLKREIAEDRVTKITKMSNTFKIFVDCVIYDAKKKVIEEGIKIHNISASDIVRLLNVDNVNHCEYVHEKLFSIIVPFHYPVVRTGITQERKVPKYIRIRNVSIMADYSASENSNGIKKLNQTLLDHTISPISPTIEKAKENLVEIFSSYAFDLGVIYLEKNVTTIELDIKVELGGFVNVYDGGIELESVLEENAEILEEESKPPVIDPDNPDDGTEDPNEPENPDDGDSVEDGFYFESYERCSENYAKAGRVISDEDYASNTYTELVYAYSDVKEDIPDIQIGEYVKYVESITILNL